MNPLSKDFNQFFINLAPNNNKEWFDEHRKEYHSIIKEPFEKFVAALIEAIQKHDPKMIVSPKDCIFRINRDIRFSKDKTPYKLNRSAAINYGGKKDFGSSGLYVEVGPEHIRIYRGLFQLEKPHIEMIRNYWAKNIETFKKAYSNKSFVQSFGTIRGETNARIDKDLKEAAEKEPLLYNKSWYFFSEMPAAEIDNPKLVDKLVALYLGGEEMCALLSKALH